MTKVTSSPRFVAFDVSKRSIVAAAVDAEQKILLQPRKITLEKFENWCQKNLYPTDRVVLEATGNAWQFYDQLQPLVASVTIANALQVKLIAQAKVKTDARDALNLAKLHAADLIPAVWVPPQPVRDLRSLVAQRNILVKQRTQCRNRLHARLMAHNLFPPEGNPFSEANLSWWENLVLSHAEKLQIRQAWKLLLELEPLIGEIEAEFLRLSCSEQWASQTIFLIQLPGFGIVTVMTILAAIGDITRFESPKKLVGYSGLGASVYASGQVCRTGSITRQGRSELRGALLEAAWSAVECSHYWKEEYTRLSIHLGKGKAIVAIARKLLVAAWHVLHKQQVDCHAEPELVARKLMNWGAKLKLEGRGQLTTREFLLQKLQCLKLEDKISSFNWNGQAYTLVAARATEVAG
jgi:transposase